MRVGTEHERADREHNEKLAEAILSDPAADNYAIACDLVGWRLTPQSPVLAGERWPLLSRLPLCPSWCMPVAEQGADVRRGQAMAACD